MNRRLSRSILVVSFVLALTAANVQARPLGDSDDFPIRARIVRIVKHVLKLIGVPTDDPTQLLPPKP